MLFIKKPEGGIRFYVDYRKLNTITYKDKYSIPLIKETLVYLFRYKIITKIDIRHSFNRVRLALRQEEDLTTFNTYFEAYKYLVLPFSLYNGLVTF